MIRQGVRSVEKEKWGLSGGSSVAVRGKQIEVAASQQKTTQDAASSNTCDPTSGKQQSTDVLWPGGPLYSAPCNKQDRSRYRAMPISSVAPPGRSASMGVAPILFVYTQRILTQTAQLMRATNLGGSMRSQVLAPGWTAERWTSMRELVSDEPADGQITHRLNE